MPYFKYGCLCSGFIVLVKIMFVLTLVLKAYVATLLGC